MQRRNWSSPLTYEERKSIQKFVREGLSCCQIAKSINRSKNAIVVEVRRGGKELYNAKKAQEDADKRRKKQTTRIKNTLKKKQPMFQMKKRIESLEMQMELLYEKVKELLNK